MQDDLKVFFLKILTRIITDKNKKKKSFNLASWNSDDWSDYKKDIE